ncbi:hypothetical protein H4S08_003415 [Coemansia sp. RSA 1365]|nr:hypothetical protein H4S08_003415 [Coemansia sp. RSA 1365]
MTDTGEVDDLHGFFQFAAGSDSDSDDNSLFVATRDRSQKFDAAHINYTPNIDEDAWFDRSDALSVDSWLSQHFGLDEITYTVQRLYFKRSYAKVVDLCKQTVLGFLSTNKRNPRMASVREIIEIGAKAAMQIDDIDSTSDFYEWYLKCGGTYPGYNKFLAEVLTKLGRHEQALVQYIEYLKQRRQDAVIWESIGTTLVEISQTTLDGDNTHETLQQLALASFCRSHLIIESCKNWRDMDFALQRKQIQSDRLLQSALKATDLLGVCVNMDNAIWQQIQSSFPMNQLALPKIYCHLSDTLCVSVKWIVSQLLHTPYDDDTFNDANGNDEKCVSEL